MSELIEMQHLRYLIEDCKEDRRIRSIVDNACTAIYVGAPRWAPHLEQGRKMLNAVKEVRNEVAAICGRWTQK